MNKILIMIIVLDYYKFKNFKLNFKEENNFKKYYTTYQLKSKKDPK